MTDSYQNLARFYDLDHAGFGDDVPFYRELARRTGGPILEAMCGSGRLLEPLARDGHQLMGVDSSASMLDLAQARLDAAGLREQVRLAEADIQRTPPGGPYALAIVALNSLMHLTTTAAQLAGLAALHRALAPGGLLAIDLFNPESRALAEYDGALTLDRSFALPDGAQVQKLVAQKTNTARQLLYVTFNYDEIAADGALRRTVQTMTLRWIYRYELEHLLARAGFAIDAIYGSYELDPYEAGSEQLLAVARRLDTK